ncbi:MULTISPECIES: hypothetical protein [unclassified Methanoregula]|uniref:hypothetical protein n=1 Tax=unclassified Methanoregula TaxID=2649730 RepID=UPI0009CD0241|nr:MULTISPECIES: hypothetical protein [unclassified Methanoregula]OPX65539.1 MAG: hypothetical protein A4E33_00081 [Methanoregula sp. PtaB.Bin085]OPY35819.1 MAG: hypothetical protein A4E34_00496 [Methanoregula sp. PtaU1.Bin006]
MKDPCQYRIYLLLLCIAFVIPLMAVAVAAQSPGSLPRGSGFTVTITGTPRTPYYVWLTGTSPMSGAPGDQPPVISGEVSGVEKDPAEGPYVIGSHIVSSGSTIIDDVAPSPDGLPGTNYYALVTTDTAGLAVVRFRTSSSTAVRTYSVRVEDRGGSSGQFQVTANLNPRTTPPTPVITTILTTATSAATPPAVTTEPPASTAVPAEPAALPPVSPIPTTGPAASPARSSPVAPWIALAVVTGALLLAAKR